MRKYIDSQFDDILETILAIVYVYFVAKNLFWFIEPLKERDDYALLLTWYEVRAEYFWDAIRRLKEMMRHPWNKMKRGVSRRDKGGADVEGSVPHKVKLVHAARAVNAARSWEREASQKHTADAKAD